MKVISVLKVRLVWDVRAAAADTDKEANHTLLFLLLGSSSEAVASILSNSKSR